MAKSLRSGGKANHARKMNPGPLLTLNHAWASNVLGLDVNLSNGRTGIDLINYSGTLGVELKWLLHGGNSWKVEDRQLSYNGNGMKCFWGFGIYETSKPLSELNPRMEIDKIEKAIIRRELYLVEWDFINQFPPSDSQGQTYFSSWETQLRYPKKSDVLALPIRRSYEVDKGYVHLTERVDGRRFRIGARNGLENVPF